MPEQINLSNITVYPAQTASPKACLLYFHGGGLLYGDRHDLPALHVQTLTQSGYTIVAFDYPLAPSATLGQILQHVIQVVNLFIHRQLNLPQNLPAELPFYLWGRSAGAFLALLSAASGKLDRAPAGILSYYGYGLLTDGWFDVPSPYYLQLPPVSETLVDAFRQTPRMHSALEEGFSLYVYGRQTGTWPSLLSPEPLDFLYQQFSLRSCEALPCPLFCAHCMGDPDVPFSEFLALSQRFAATRFLAPGAIHDFDRLTADLATKRLYKATLAFLDEHLPAAK